MTITFVEESNLVRVEKAGEVAEYTLYSDEAFRVIADLYTKVGWNQRHCYTFSWMGRPIIQFPDDMVRIQEVIYQVRPDVIVETGVAHGGSLIYYASILKAMGKGRVIGIDIEIRPHNRQAIEEHLLFDRIDLLVGSSVAPETVREVQGMIKPGETVLVILDSNHSYSHVAEELVAYSPMVSPGSFIVSTDGIMREVSDAPRGTPEWTTDNPANAAEDFAAANPQFSLEQPSWPFNESSLTTNVTHWPSAYLKRLA